MTHALALTDEEQANVRKAIRFLHRQAGNWMAVSSLIGVQSIEKIWQGRTVTEVVAFRVARLCKVPVDDVLAGRFPARPRCPHCGHELELDLVDHGTGTGSG